jgi:tRNA-splicing ligase RtcB
MKLCIHRKGATRAFGPGHPAVTPVYRDVGQPVLVPGDMGTASYVLVGTADAMDKSFGTSCHGAGRTMSWHAAQRRIHGGTLRKDLGAQGIHVRAGSTLGLAEEAPDAYKDIDAVIEVEHSAGLARKVARLRPLAVLKG